MKSSEQAGLTSEAKSRAPIGFEAYPWLKSYPKHVDWFQRFIPLPLPSFLDQAVARFPASPATEFFGETLSYADLGDAVNRATKGLQRLGVGEGTRVGLLFPNCPAFIVFYYAILKAGGTVVGLNPLYTIPELAFQVKDAGVAVVVTLDLVATFPKAKALVESGIVRHVVVERFRDMLPSPKGFLFSLFKRKDVASWKAGSGVIASRGLLKNDGRFAPCDIGVNSIAALQYTGGTTGTPKGAMLTHANLSINVQQIDSWFPGLAVDGHERFLCVIPFFHSFAMTALMNFAIRKAAQMIMLPRFDVKQALKLIHEARPTIMAGVPTLFNALAKAPDIKSHDLSSLKFCISGGAPLPIEVKRDFERVSGCKLLEGYGLSETSPVTHLNPAGGAVREGSIGLPLPGTIISLRELGAPEREAPLGQRGEICICGPQVMKGYWNKPQETAAAFTGEFLRTGDVAYMDDDGFAYIVDRIKDLILCSGFNVYPRRIEEAIHEHPAVDEVTVIGIPDKYRGEAPKAFVKLRQGERVTAGEMIEFLTARISKIEMPAEIEFREALPKTSVGKLSKKELVAEEKARRQ
ncbi:MAG TPA: long-chain fatty acid--CoA ligase [Rhodomicrobium sp.]|nr:long-chain fatty acid--CoA ligase [Rhodomicrobium sp.]